MNAVGNSLGVIPRSGLASFEKKSMSAATGVPSLWILVLRLSSMSGLLMSWTLPMS